ncbi:hypothetical protein ENBRE01_1131 [Enteropsectra breve]|nr:hypothetical protein ENBRE01_1131 [Enteropsectra breve]
MLLLGLPQRYFVAKIIGYLTLGGGGAFITYKVHKGSYFRVKSAPEQKSKHAPVFDKHDSDKKGLQDIDPNFYMASENSVITACNNFCNMDDNDCTGKDKDLCCTDEMLANAFNGATGNAKPDYYLAHDSMPYEGTKLPEWGDSTFEEYPANFNQNGGYFSNESDEHLLFKGVSPYTHREQFMYFEQVRSRKPKRINLKRGQKQVMLDPNNNNTMHEDHNISEKTSIIKPTDPVDLVSKKKENDSALKIKKMKKRSKIPREEKISIQNEGGIVNNQAVLWDTEESDCSKSAIKEIVVTDQDEETDSDSKYFAEDASSSKQIKNIDTEDEFANGEEIIFDVMATEINEPGKIKDKRMSDSDLVKDYLKKFTALLASLENVLVDGDKFEPSKRFLLSEEQINEFIASNEDLDLWGDDKAISPQQIPLENELALYFADKTTGIYPLDIVLQFEVFALSYDEKKPSYHNNMYSIFEKPVFDHFIQVFSAKHHDSSEWGVHFLDAIATNKSILPSMIAMIFSQKLSLSSKEIFFRNLTNLFASDLTYLNKITYADVNESIKAVGAMFCARYEKCIVQLFPDIATTFNKIQAIISDLTKNFLVKVMLRALNLHYFEISIRSSEYILGASTSPLDLQNSLAYIAFLFEKKVWSVNGQMIDKPESGSVSRDPFNSVHKGFYVSETLLRRLESLPDVNSLDFILWAVTMLESKVLFVNSEFFNIEMNLSNIAQMNSVKSLHIYGRKLIDIKSFSKENDETNASLQSLHFSLNTKPLLNIVSHLMPGIEDLYLEGIDILLDDFKVFKELRDLRSLDLYCCIINLEMAIQNPFIQEFLRDKAERLRLANIFSAHTLGKLKTRLEQNSSSMQPEKESEKSNTENPGENGFVLVPPLKQGLEPKGRKYSFESSTESSDSTNLILSITSSGHSTVNLGETESGYEKIILTESILKHWNFSFNKMKEINISGIFDRHLENVLEMVQRFETNSGIKIRYFENRKTFSYKKKMISEKCAFDLVVGFNEIALY